MDKFCKNQALITIGINFHYDNHKQQFIAKYLPKLIVDYRLFGTHCSWTLSTSGEWNIISAVQCKNKLGIKFYYAYLSNVYQRLDVMKYLDNFSMIGFHWYCLFRLNEMPTSIARLLHDSTEEILPNDLVYMVMTGSNGMQYFFSHYWKVLI